MAIKIPRGVVFCHPPPWIRPVNPGPGTSFLDNFFRFEGPATYLKAGGNRITGMNRIILTFLLIVIGCISQSMAAEVIGPHEVRAPDSATLVAGTLGGGSLNVVDVLTDINAAFSGESIIDDGYANVDADKAVEVVFDVPVINRAGPDLILYDARYDDGSYVVSTEFDGFVSGLALHALDDFVSTGIVKDYYFNFNGRIFPATVFAAEIDLSDLGLPLGASVERVRFSATNGRADPLGIGALVPEPGTFAMCIGFGVATVFSRARNVDR